MADQQLDILIKTLADTHGAKNVEESLKRVNAQQDKSARITNEKSVPASKNVSRAFEEQARQTSKAASKSKQMQDSMRGLATQMPILSRFVEVAVNPLGAAFAAAAASVGIFAARMRMARQILQGFELPDLPDKQFVKLSEAAKLWQDYAAAVSKASEASSSIAGTIDASIQKIQQEAKHERELLAARKANEMARATTDEERLMIESKYAFLGEKLSERTATSVAEQKQFKRGLLTDSAAAARREAAGITVAGADQDAANLAALEENAKIAEADNRKRQQRIKRLIDQKHGNVGLSYLDEVKNKIIVAGYLASSGLSIDEQIALERESIASNQNVIGQRDAFRSRLADRDALRARRAELLSQAASDQSSAIALGVQIPSELAASRRDIAVGREVAAINADTANVELAVKQAVERLGNVMVNELEHVNRRIANQLNP